MLLYGARCLTSPSLPTLALPPPFADVESLSAELTLLRAARASSDKMTAELQQQLADVQAKVKDLAAKASNVDFLRVCATLPGGGVEEGRREEGQGGVGAERR